MPKIEAVILRCLDPQSQREFYCSVLGMTEFPDHSVGYGESEARLHFVPATQGYDPSSNDLYWKIAIAIPNIELASQQLIERGVVVGNPHQFRDIGFLAHFTDPEGFTVELIEHWFEGHRQEEVTDPRLLGGGAHLNLLTLRTGNIERVIETCEGWGMRLLSIQPVVEHGFTLYFYAFTDDCPPSSDLYSVENRPWLYQRRYTVLEIQHVHDAASMNKASKMAGGYAGAVLSDLPEGCSTNDKNHLGII